MTDDPDIRMATSVVDYIFRRLALDFLPLERRAELGIFTAKERAAQVRAEAAGEEFDLTALAASAPVEKKPLGASPAAVAETRPPAKPEATPAEDMQAERLAVSSMEVLERVAHKESDAPLCFTCGTKMRPAGSCYVCEGCGSTSGCS
jgi:ribonucleoside-diphosphate reductase alpha chain